MGAPYLSYISWYFMDSRSHKHGQTLDGCVWKLAHASKIIMLPSGKTNSLLLKKAIEIVYNILYGWYLRWVFPLKMVMFHSYVRKIMIHLWICRDQPGWIPVLKSPHFLVISKLFQAAGAVAFQNPQQFLHIFTVFLTGAFYVGNGWVAGGLLGWKNW